MCSAFFNTDALHAARCATAEVLTEVASLERQIVAAQVNLARQSAAAEKRRHFVLHPLPKPIVTDYDENLWDRKAELEAAVQGERACNEEHMELRSKLTAEIRAAEAESSSLHSELQATVQRSVTLTAELSQLRACTAKEESMAHHLEEEHRQVAELHSILEHRHNALSEETSCESANARAMRQKLDDRGWGLSLLRSMARTHVEDLQTSVITLDQQLKRALGKAVEAAGAGHDANG